MTRAIFFDTLPAAVQYTIYGIYDWRGRCGYIGVTKDLNYRKKKGWKGVLSRGKRGNRIIHALRKVYGISNALRIEGQVIQAYVRRGQANHNVVKRVARKFIRTRVLIIDEFTPLIRTVSRQRIYQLRMSRDGMCPRCGLDNSTGKSYCANCTEKHRQAAIRSKNNRRASHSPSAKPRLLVTGGVSLSP